MVTRFITALLLTSTAGACAGGAVSTPAGNTFTTTVTADEAAAQDPGAAGTWEITLSEDGSFQVRRGGGVDVAVEGRYAIEGNRITFTDEGGPLMCAEVTGAYEWSLAGDQLTMRSVDDTCPGRLAVLTTGPLTLKTP